MWTITTVTRLTPTITRTQSRTCATRMSEHIFALLVFEFVTQVTPTLAQVVLESVIPSSRHAHVRLSLTLFDFSLYFHPHFLVFFLSSPCSPTTLTPWLTTCATPPRRATTAPTSPSHSQFQMDRCNLIVMVTNVMSLKRRSMWWKTLILSPQTSNPCVRKLYCMCSKTMKQWSKWSFKEGALQWDMFPGLTELHLIGCLIDLIWIPKSKSNTSTPKTNSQTS